MVASCAHHTIRWIYIILYRMYTWDHILKTEADDAVSNTAVREHKFQILITHPLLAIQFAIHILLSYQCKKYRYANCTAL
jgi:hypothetical protein